MNVLKILLSCSLVATVSLVSSQDESVRFKHSEYQLEQLQNATDVFKPYKADTRIKEFLAYVDTFLPLLQERIGDKLPFTEVLKSEIVNFEDRHRLMKTYLMVALLDGKPLGF